MASPPISRRRAHPRSRGENGAAGMGWDCAAGSSPLTRGKRPRRDLRARQRGLIPAHAGKTKYAMFASAPLGAHPRSRGENSGVSQAQISRIGSSPLTRGKRGDQEAVRRRRGLIPAHAGKTSNEVIGSPVLRAHPRSRGENCRSIRSVAGVEGSSPLTRGKRVEGGRRQRCQRLIPAHAGKTTHRPQPLTVTSAHPRSRGEN